MSKYGLGADPSPYDLRTFAYTPSGVPKSGGVRYKAKDIENQHKVGICTSAATVMNAQKAMGIKFSPEFHYLMQKRNAGNWNEGSSLSSALNVAKKIGFLPLKYWTFTTEEDRKLPYHKYIAKLQAVPESTLDKLRGYAEPYRIIAYSKVPVDPDTMAMAIMESKAGLLTRYVVGNEWWKAPVEPLRPAKEPISGHAVSDTDFSGESFYVANSWGADWATNGSAQRVHSKYKPTEAFLVYYEEAPEEVRKQLEARKTKMAKVIDLLQEIISAFQKIQEIIKKK